MKTLQKPGTAGTVPGPAVASPPPGYFTADDVEVADVLVFLQDSSTSTGRTRTVGDGSSVAFAASGSSSPRSVNAPHAPAPAPAPARQPALPRGVGARRDAEEDEDEQEVHGNPRRIKRWRPIAEIYRATQRIGRRTVKNKE